MSASVDSVLSPGASTQRSLDSVAPHARRLFVSQTIRRTFRMAILLLAARMLGVESFGVYALLLTVVEMIGVISGTGTMDFLTREVAGHPDSAWPLGRSVLQLRLAYLAPGLGLALVILSVLRFPSSVLVNLAWLALTLIPRAAGESAQGIMKGLRHFSPLPWVELTQGSVVLVCAPVLILEGLGIRGVIAAEIAGVVASALVATRCVAGRLNFSAVDSRTLRTLAASTLTFNVYPLIATVYDRVDVVLLAKLAGSFAVGIYSLPYRAFSMLSVIPYGLMGALLPVFSADSGRQEIQETCSRAMKFLFATALMIVLVTIAFAGPIVPLLLGPGYSESVIVIKVLVWAAVPAFLNFALNVLLLSAHRERAFLWTGITCTILNVAANLLLIPRFSYLAAAAVTIATECLLLAQNVYLVGKAMGRVVLPKDGLKIAVVFAGALAAFWLLQRAVPELWAGAAACAAFGVFAMAMMPGLRQMRLAPVRRGAE